MFCCLAAARFLVVRFWVVLDCVVGYCGIYVVLHFLVVCAGGVCVVFLWVCLLVVCYLYWLAV